MRKILRPRAVQRPARTPQTLTAPEGHPASPKPRTAASVRIRLHGAPADVAATLGTLAAVLDIRAASRPYPDRPRSTCIRVYLDATTRTDREESK